MVVGSTLPMLALKVSGGQRRSSRSALRASSFMGQFVLGSRAGAACSFDAQEVGPIDMWSSALGAKGLWLREVVGPAARLDGIDATDRALRGRAGIHVELVAQMREPHAAGAQSLASPIQQWGSVRIDASDVCLSCLQAHHIGHARTNCSRCSSRAACNASDFLSTGSPRDA